MKNQYEEIELRFTYRPPQDNQVERYELIRKHALKFAHLLSTLTPECREQEIALAALENAVMWANTAIARREYPVPAEGGETITLAELEHDQHIDAAKIQTAINRAQQKVAELRYREPSQVTAVYHVELMPDTTTMKIRPERVELPVSDAAMILRINECIQHEHAVQLGGKEVVTVALDHSYWLKDGDEGTLTDGQLLDLFNQANRPLSPEIQDTCL